MVDEQKEVATKFQAAREKLWEATLGCHARGWWMPDDKESPWGTKKRHQVPSLFGFGETGKLQKGHQYFHLIFFFLILAKKLYI